MMNWIKKNWRRWTPFLLLTVGSVYGMIVGFSGEASSVSAGIAWAVVALMNLAILGYHYHTEILEDIIKGYEELHQLLSREEKTVETAVVTEVKAVEKDVVDEATKIEAEVKKVV